MNDLINKGYIELNARECPTEATIIVMGVARSGTSMIARVLRELGLYMGETDDVVYEDNILGPSILSRDINQMRSVISVRNMCYSKWGIKKPDAYKLGIILENEFRNPRFIIIFRDPLAVAIRNNIAMGAEFIKNMSITVQGQQQIISSLANTHAPHLLISYEKALQFPELLVKFVERFAGLQATPTSRDCAIRSIENGRAEYIENARIK